MLATKWPKNNGYWIDFLGTDGEEPKNHWMGFPSNENRSVRKGFEILTVVVLMQKKDLIVDANQ